MRTFFYAVFTLLFMSSCDSNSDDLSTIDPLLGSWELVNIISQPDLISEPPNSSKVTITFVNDGSKEFNFSGNSTCNQYGGQVVRITKDDISLDNIFATEIACIDDSFNEFERIYLSTLAQVEGYSIENDTLILSLGSLDLTFNRIDL